MITLTSEQLKQNELSLAIAKCIADDGDVRDLLTYLNLQPTSQAFALAAQAAALVLAAHDLGQTVEAIRVPRLNGNGHKPPRKPSQKTAAPKSGRIYRCKTCSAGPWPTYKELIAHKQELHP